MKVMNNCIDVTVNQLYATCTRRNRMADDYFVFWPVSGISACYDVYVGRFLAFKTGE